MALTFIPRLFKNLDAVGSGSSGGGLTTVNNGLSVTGTTGQLGGNLIQDTLIDGGYNLTIGSVTPLTNISFYTFDGGADNTSLVLDPNEVDLYYSLASLAYIGLSLDVNRANLYWGDTGGDVKQLNVDTSGIGIDTISGGSYFSYLKNDNTTTNRTFQFPDADGTLALISDFTASNGLTKVITDFRLGGVLTANTTINISTFILNLVNTTTYAGVTISSTAVRIGDGQFTNDANYFDFSSGNCTYINDNISGKISFDISGATNGGFNLRTVASGSYATLKTTNLSAGRTYEFVNRTGTLALRELNVRPISSVDTALTTDDVIEITANTFTLSLYTAVGNSGKPLIITNQGTGTVTVDPNGTETMNGLTTTNLTQYQTLHLVSDGTNWIII